MDSTGKAEYRSARRSRKLIRRAFMELSSEIPLRKITVSDIVRRADINRGTFYAHYADVRALVEQIEEELIAKMLEIADTRRYAVFCLDPLPSLTMVTEFLAKDLDFYRALASSDEAALFAVRMSDIYVEHMMHDDTIPAVLRSSPFFEVIIRFYSAGLINTYISWFRGKLDVTLEEVAEMLSEGIKTGSMTVIK